MRDIRVGSTSSAHKAGRCVAAAFVLMATLACGSEPVAMPSLEEDSTSAAPPSQPGGAPFTSELVTFTVLATDWASGIESRRRLVLQDSASWREIWEEWLSTRWPKPPLPAVEFDSRMVVVVSQGEQSTGGYAIRVESVFTTREGYVVFVESRSPGTSCVTTASLSQPVQAISLPRTSGSIEFEESSLTVECA